MRALLGFVTGTFLVVRSLAAPAHGADCTSEDFAKAVNDAGSALRKLSADNTPRLQAKMAQLKARRKWPDVGYEERAYRELQDERVTALDAAAGSLLAKIDALGTVDSGSAPDCSKLEELQAASLELQATVKTKTGYLLSKLDQMLSDAPVAALPKARPGAPKAEAKVEPKPDAKANVKPHAKVAEAETKPEPRFPAAVESALKPETASKPSAISGWSTRTQGDAPGNGPAPGALAMAEPPPGLDTGPPSETDGYTIEEIRSASAGFFGQVSANLGAVIEHLFRKSGRPTGYVLGTEGGGAFLAGLRYGDGTLYMRAGGTRRIFWHGPTLGADIGGAGSKTLFLIYKMKAPEDLYSNFTGIDGSAYLVGGVGVTLVTNGRVVIAPIRSGVGLRLGASVGYLRFTPKPTWNPF
jgi:hypothetical protein